MTILFRYLLREYAKVFLMCFAGLLTVYLVVDFFEKIRRFIHYDAEILTILGYFLLKTPTISMQIAPLAVLMGALLTMGMFTRNYEITAMRSCGISLARIASPFFLFALSVGLLLLWFTATVIPLANSRAEYIKHALIEKKQTPKAFKSDHPWIQIGPRTLMNVNVVDPEGMHLSGVSVYVLGPGFTLDEFLEAREARFTDQGWMLFDGVHRQLLPEGRLVISRFDRQLLALAQTPEDIHAWLSLEPEEMTLVDIRDYVERLQHDGYNVARILTDYYGRIAFPFASVVMAIVGVALSLRRVGVRGGGVALGIGQALVLGFLYWSTHSVGIALGRSGVLAPVLAGWVTNLLFLSFGCYLFLKVRQ